MAGSIYLITSFYYLYIYYFYSGRTVNADAVAAGNSRTVLQLQHTVIERQSNCYINRHLASYRRISGSEVAGRSTVLI